MSYYVTSFIEIARHVSEDRLVCDGETTISDLISEDFDTLDFELALYCFEATHKLAFDDKLWDLELEEIGDLTIEGFVETFLDRQDQTDPLFVTRRFMMYRDTLEDAWDDNGRDLD
jgi:hypothetical protein